MFGNETDIEDTSALGGPTCQTVGGGTIENPVGGGAGDGRTNSLARYECKAGNAKKKCSKNSECQDA
jgi:hypothetical protein